jgi:hypothetical protein
VKQKIYLITVVEKRTVPVIASSLQVAVAHVGEHSERNTSFWEDDAVFRTYENAEVKEFMKIPKAVRDDPSKLLMFTDAAEDYLKKNFGVDDITELDLEDAVAMLCDKKESK